MTLIDTNVLLPAVEADNVQHKKAAAFLDSLHGRDDVIISEFVLLELSVLLRNPAVLAKSLDGAKASAVCEAFRRHPRWQLVGFAPDSRAFHDELWPRLREKQFARRRAYDSRMALTLLRHGVREFATVNVKDFEGLGFARVWNPLRG